MVDIVELDTHFEMTPEQAFARAQRDDLEKVIIIGRNEEGILIMTVSDMDSFEVYWALNKAVQAIFDG